MAQTVFVKYTLSLSLAVCLSAVLLCGVPAAAEVGVRPASEISNDTIDWMKKVADWQLTQSSWDSSVSWERGALHAGMMSCYEATKDETYLNACRQFAQKFNWQLSSTSHHADNNAVGQVFMELYFLDQQDPSRYEGTSRRFKEVSDTHVALWPTFYCNVRGDSNLWWWCDALFMAPPGLVRLSRATGDPSYINLMHKMWKDTQDCLYDTQDALFFRDIDYLWPDHNYNGEKVFWSRGNGWVIAGTARVLEYLPPEDPLRARYITLLQEMSAKLAAIQLEDGYWHSDLLSPERYDNPESSGTGFFTYGLAWGINNGFLDEAAYWDNAASGWQALKAAVQPSGLLGWVQPVGQDPQQTSATTTDVFGVGAYLLAGSEVQKYLMANDPNAIERFESYLTDAALQTAWADGTANGTSSQVALGDYGDNFMELTYQNDLPPYRSQVDYAFASPKNFIACGSDYYLSVLVRGDAANAPATIYVRLEDTSSASAVQIMTEPNVVRTEAWMELGFSLSGFSDINLQQITRLSIGAGTPDASAPTGQGTIRVDNIHLYPTRCLHKPADLAPDCRINLPDFAVLAAEWLEEYGESIEPADPGTTNLVAYWSLDGHYDDATGNHNAAPASGSSTIAFVDPGHSGQSAAFDGAGGLECGNSTNMDLTGGGTVSAWIKSNGQTHDWACVVAKGINTWRLIRNNWGTGSEIAFHFDRADSGEFRANGSTPVMDNEWHHVMGIYDGSTIRLYIDGQLDAWADTSGALLATSTDPVYIGSRVGKLSDRSWNGQIDEVRIYETALDEPGRLWLSEGQGYTRVPDPPRPTDLVPDGRIDLSDLEKLLENWAQDTYWP